jgi:ABC-type microcin C transport system permease subunit YejB
MRRWFERVVLTRPVPTFVVLVVAFLVFGGGSFSLFFVLKANLDLVAEHGWQALADGAAIQFLELMCAAAVSMAAYVVFKACEHRLVHWLCYGHKKEES